MEIRILNEKVIKTEAFYNDFLEGNINLKDEYFSDNVINIEDAPYFPIYIAKGSEEEKKELFSKAINTISEYYINKDRDIHMNKMFWYSLFCTKMREYLLNEYPQIKDSIKNFHNVVLKKFDWENYVYKCILAAEYIKDYTEDKLERERYIGLIVDNLDFYNYILKYPIFRNQEFLIKMLNIVDRLNLSAIFKAKIENRVDDVRYGRMVLFEMNKSYPVIIAPAMSEEDLEELTLKYLGYYYKELPEPKCIQEAY
ncbi:hypothetical protein [Intestinibacter sp.]|uniref:hypothetical protein n=1 Tax=Intestinibacter sp. TaxID=1965304 RepID=UPI002A91A27A|nr:hypothetical protein [Intestinibacter sp.]MDY5211668.1 hypothetical protein [Intestinibacter sp.]